MVAGPFVGLPRGPGLVGEGILVVLALEAEGFVLPGELQDLEDLLEGLAIVLVDLALVAHRGADLNLLGHLVEPAGLITPGESDVGPALGELVEPGDFDRQTQRVPARQYVADRTDLQGRSVVDDVLGQYRKAADLHAFRMQVMLGEGDPGEAQVFGHARDFHHLVEHLLPALGVVSDGAQVLALLGSRGQRGKEEVHELHGAALLWVPRVLPIRGCLPILRGL